MSAPVPIPKDLPSFSLGLTWDSTNPAQRPADLDLACIMVDGQGLIIDACFFNNPLAAQGSMIHSGDSTSGAPSIGGIAEAITVMPNHIPAHAYALVFCAMCTNSGDFSLVANAQVHLLSPNGPLLHPLPLDSLAITQQGQQPKTLAVLGLSRRSGEGASWAFEPVLYGFPAPVRNFIDVFDHILAIININPAVAKELLRHQPVFNVKKGESVNLPVGLKDVKFGLGWDSNVDVDSSCIGLDFQGRPIMKVWYGSLEYQGVVKHSGDNRTGAGSGDDETINVKMNKIPLNCQALFFTVNVFSGANGFKDVKGEYCALKDKSGKEIAKFKSLDAAAGNINGIVLIALYRDIAFPSRWIFTAPAYGASGRTCQDLVDECQMLQAKYINKGILPQSWVPPTQTSALVPPPAFYADVVLEKCENLTPMDSNGKSDPYVKVIDCDLYDKELLKTKCYKKNLNPIFDPKTDKFTFKFDFAGNADLKFKIYDKDLIRDDKIGTVKFKLNWLQLGDKQTICLPLMKNKKEQGLLYFTLTKRPTTQ